MIPAPPTVRVSAGGLGRLSTRVLLPLMVLTIILAQQEGTLFGIAAQIVSTVTMVTAITLALTALGAGPGPVLFISGTILLRLLRIVSSAPSLELAYTVTTGALYCLVGAAVALRAPRMAYRQLVWLWILSVPMMLLQLGGVGAWTQALRTDAAGDWGQYPTLFRGATDVVISAMQARPGGIFPSNNLLSFILLFTLGLHFARANRPRLSWRDGLLTAAAVLSMAKIVYLTFVVMAVWTWLIGDRARRKRAVRLVLLLAGLTAVYSWMFPGVFAFNTAWPSIYKNFSIRLADLLLATGWAPLTRLVNIDSIPGLELSLKQGRQSGYALIGRFLPIVLIGLVFGLPWFMRGVRILRRHAPEWIPATTLCLIAVGFLPLITSFLSSVMYWFMAGFALLPVLLLVERRLRRMLETGVPDVERRP